MLLTEEKFTIIFLTLHAGKASIDSFVLLEHLIIFVFLLLQDKHWNGQFHLKLSLNQTFYISLLVCAVMAVGKLQSLLNKQQELQYALLSDMMTRSISSHCYPSIRYLSDVDDL